MKKTEKVFNEVNNGLDYIQNLNDKRNEEHQESFLFLSAQRDEDGELPFLNVVCSADDEVLVEMVLKVLEKEPEIRIAILKASKKYQEKQCLKAIEAASEGFKKIAEMFNRPMPPKYPLGGLMAGKPHDEGEEMVIPASKGNGHLGDIYKSIEDSKIQNKLTELRKNRLNLLTKIEEEKKAVKDHNRELFSKNSVIAMLENDLALLEQEIVKVELDKREVIESKSTVLEIKCNTPLPSPKNEVCLMEDEAYRIFKSSGKLKGDEDYSECESVIGDYIRGEKLFFFENCCSNEIVMIENYDALRYALTKELIIYKFNLL